MVEPIHPSEEHELVAETVTRRVLDRRGHVVGQHATILPGSLEEREALALIDDARWRELQPQLGADDRARRARRYWRQQRP
jgi:hypothetical protein